MKFLVVFTMLPSAEIIEKIKNDSDITCLYIGQDLTNDFKEFICDDAPSTFHEYRKMLINTRKFNLFALYTIVIGSMKDADYVVSGDDVYKLIRSKIDEININKSLFSW